MSREKKTVWCTWNSDFTSLTSEIRWTFAEIDCFIHSFTCTTVHTRIVETCSYDWTISKREGSMEDVIFHLLTLFFTFWSRKTSWTLTNESIFTFVTTCTTILTGIWCITTTYLNRSTYSKISFGKITILKVVYLFHISLIHQSFFRMYLDDYHRSTCRKVDSTIEYMFQLHKHLVYLDRVVLKSRWYEWIFFS